MRCEGKIWRDRHYTQCSCEAKVTREGKDYCGTHDPVRRKEKEAARNAKWDAEWEACKVRAAANAVARARAELCVAACIWMTDTEVSLLAAIPKASVLSLIYRKL